MGNPDDTTQSKQRDPFDALYGDGEGQLVEPPFRYETIATLFDKSDVLESCIDAMAVNVGGFGVQLVPFGGAIPEANKTEADAEWSRLKAWIDGASTSSWTELHKRTRVDLELFGDAYWEVLRNARGDIVGIEHCRTFYTRKTRLDTRAVESQRWARDASGEWVQQSVWRRFRRFAQWIGGQRVWFREFGDARPLSASTGRVGGDVARDDLATELICWSLYSPDSIYGKPRWRGAAESVTGRVAAAEINSNGFDNLGIPPLLITVSGALLGPQAVERVKEYFGGVRGRKSRYTPLIIEAANAAVDSSPTGDATTAPVKIAVEDLSRVQQNDALFMKYSASCAEDVRRTFRLPPLFVGTSNDYTRATADASKLVGEEQVFAPERSEVEAVLNRSLLPELGARWWEIRLRGAPLLSEDVLLKLLEVGVKSGALSSSEVADALEPLLGRDLSREEAWAKMPSSLVDALVAAGWVPDGVQGLKPPAAPAGDVPPQG